MWKLWTGNNRQKSELPEATEKPTKAGGRQVDTMQEQVREQASALIPEKERPGEHVTIHAWTKNISRNSRDEWTHFFQITNDKEHAILLTIPDCEINEVRESLKRILHITPTGFIGGDFSPKGHFEYNSSRVAHANGWDDIFTSAGSDSRLAFIGEAFLQSLDGEEPFPEDLFKYVVQN